MSSTRGHGYLRAKAARELVVDFDVNKIYFINKSMTQEKPQ